MRVFIDIGKPITQFILFANICSVKLEYSPKIADKKLMARVKNIKCVFQNLRYNTSNVLFNTAQGNALY